MSNFEIAPSIDTSPFLDASYRMSLRSVLGVVFKARAIRTMFRRAMFCSPRSTAPIVAFLVKSSAEARPGTRAIRARNKRILWGEGLLYVFRTTNSPLRSRHHPVRHRSSGTEASPKISILAERRQRAATTSLLISTSFPQNQLPVKHTGHL